MEWQPDEQAWNTYIKFELRYDERFIITHPEPKNWISSVKFEQQNSYIKSARRIYEREIEFFGEEHLNKRLLLDLSVVSPKCGVTYVPADDTNSSPSYLFPHRSN